MTPTHQDEVIARLREKALLDIPVVILTVMLSISIHQVTQSTTVAFFLVLLLCMIVIRAITWYHIEHMASTNNYVAVVITYLQIALLFVLFYICSMEDVPGSVITITFVFLNFLLLAYFIFGTAIVYESNSPEPVKRVVPHVFLGTLMVLMMGMSPLFYPSTIGRENTLILMTILIVLITYIGLDWVAKLRNGR